MASVRAAQTFNGEPGSSGTDSPSFATAQEQTAETSKETESESDGGGQDEARSGPGTTEEGNYLKAFRSERHHMPHWKNVFAKSRSKFRGFITLLSLYSEGGRSTIEPRRLPEEGNAKTLKPSTLTTALSTAPEPDANQPAHALLITDLSWSLINSLGPSLCLSPEVFEQHLVRSGYTETSYDDPDPSYWPTRFLPKQTASLRWYSLVRRKDIPARNERERRKLVERRLIWRRRIRNKISSPSKKPTWQRLRLTTQTNIYRQEWLISALYRPPKRDLVYNDEAGSFWDFGEGDGYDEKDDIDGTSDEELDIVAWEERVTFCWGDGSGGKIPIFFLDPLPYLTLQIDDNYDENRTGNMKHYRSHGGWRLGAPA
ncbi:hypothetical protein MMYC01_202487 [Madurella mycetomatis]|uniref:Uncharacterized protein n=1 Tax=Madurella mycetomatis TaxID=100816 RepID=A0A175WCL7_9PEZI|nr:hypothetical protein MMYC01_202487 [Madurella mycetomatis]